MINETANNNSYLSFRLGKEIFATNVSCTLKILQMSDITKVPGSPANMEGVINHHGNVLPVVDLNHTLGLPRTEHTKSTCIIVLSIGKNDDLFNIGVIVDEVLNVENINFEQIKDPPSLGSKNSLDNVSGVYKNGETFIMILNINNIFNEINLEK
ncbi:MAG: chemotaxis protein CheW [Bacteroidota bacterium]